MNYFSAVDHGTLDQGASLLKSNRLSSAMASQSKVKGITCCCDFFCSIFYVILFYFIFYHLLVAVIYKGPKKVVDFRH